MDNVWKWFYIFAELAVVLTGGKLYGFSYLRSVIHRESIANIENKNTAEVTLGGKSVSDA